MKRQEMNPPSALAQFNLPEVVRYVCAGSPYQLGYRIHDRPLCWLDVLGQLMFRDWLRAMARQPLTWMGLVAVGIALYLSVGH
jgi:hypothetical protein